MAQRRFEGREGNLSKPRSWGSGLAHKEEPAAMRRVWIFVVVASLFVAAHGAAYGDPLLSYTPQMSGGTLITFDGRTEGELISNQFPGVTFSQFGGTTYPG